MMVMASPIPILFVGKFLSTIRYPFYYATAANEWRELIHPHIPDWLMVHDLEIARKFYEGGPPEDPHCRATPLASRHPLIRRRINAHGVDHNRGTSASSREKTRSAHRGPRTG